MRSPNRSLFLTVGLLVILTLACSSEQLPEQRVHASTSSAPSQENSTTVTAVVKARKANLRDRPSMTATVVNTVDRGELLTLTRLKPTGPWYHTRDSKAGSEGWIHGNAIDLLQTSTTNPASTAQTTRPRAISPQRTASSPAPGKSYVNVDGIHVKSPVFSDTKPEGASARCRDGSYSFSLHRRGTCSHHGGVAEWY